MEEKKSFQLAREVAWYFFWFCVQGNKGGSQVEGFLSLLKKKKSVALQIRSYRNCVLT